MAIGDLTSNPGIEDVVARLGDVDSLPQVVTKAFNVMNDSGSSSQDLVNVIGLDQGMTARILATANSAYFGASRRFVNLREAIVRLGYRNTHSIMCAASASSSLCRPVTIYGMARNQLWKHSVACAVGSKVIARQRKLPDPEEAYVAGLLHDIGLPVLDRFALQSAQSGRLNEVPHCSSDQAERRAFGFDHAHLGSLICEKWRLAPELVTAVSTHHNPFGIERPSKLAAIVHIADVISLLPEVGVGTTRFSATANPDVVSWLGFELSEVERVVAQVRGYLGESEAFVMGTASD